MSIPLEEVTADPPSLRQLLEPFAAGGRTALLPALQAVQAHAGYISAAAAAEVARALGIPLTDVHGVIEFYSLLYGEPVGRTVVRVCTDPSCALRGADAVLGAACRRAGVEVGGTSADGAYTVERSPCLGQCNAGVSVNANTTEDLSVIAVGGALGGSTAGVAATTTVTPSAVRRFTASFSVLS